MVEDGAEHFSNKGILGDPILLDDPNDTVVLQEIQRNSSTFGDGKRRYQHDHLSGDITAHWDSNQRKGVSILLVGVVGVAFAFCSCGYLTILSSH
jgi:hypothetical protein